MTSRAVEDGRQREMEINIGYDEIMALVTKQRDDNERSKTQKHQQDAHQLVLMHLVVTHTEIPASI